MQWIDIVQTVGSVASITVALWQMLVQTRQITAATDTALADTVPEINLLPFEHPETFSEFDKPFPTHGGEQVGDRRYHLMQLILNTFEQAFKQPKYGFVDRAAWESWIRMLIVRQSSDNDLPS